MSRLDLVLLHPPSVYDFRKEAIMYGPVSDLIPSSPVFEMYPLGFLTMTNYLESRGMEVRIVNLALRMMNDPVFDVSKFLSRLAPQAFGIDLHWLPHAHGALEIARLVKQVHPHTPVIFGGLSASYYCEELIAYPQVDFVLRGDSVEMPLHQLLLCLKRGGALDEIPNLAWKRDGDAQFNALSCISANIDYVDLAPERIIRMVMRHHDLQSVLPFNGWWQNPITAVFTVRGCMHECVTCGGSGHANGLLNKRHKPAFRSPLSLVRNIADVSRFSRGPIFLVGDLFQAGMDYVDESLARIKAADIENEIVFEVFGMPSRAHLQAIDRSVRNWSLELSPESHDEEIRRHQDAQVFYRNQEMERVIEDALRLGCHRLDVFFMIGLSRQTRASVMETIGYCEKLFRSYDRRLSCFISPMGPFLDPGSRGFEDPERYGYRLFARTLEEHRQLLLQPSWGEILNYETLWMSRNDMVEVTYDAAEALNGLKLKYGRISKARGEAVARRIVQARMLQSRLVNAQNGGDPSALAMLRGEIHAFSVSTVCDKRELFWRRHVMNFKWPEIVRIGMNYLREQGGR